MRNRAPQITLAIIVVILAIGLINYFVKQVSVPLAKVVSVPDITVAGVTVDVLIAISAILIILVAVLLWYRKRSLKSAKHSSSVDFESLSNLRKYVTDSLSAGHSEQAVKNTLLSVGWKKEIVDRIFKE